MRAATSNSRRHRGPSRSGSLAHFRRRALRDRLDRLGETGLRWGVSGATVLGALHPSSRDQQPSFDRRRRRASDLPLEGLRARKSVAHDVAHRDGVPPPLRAARAPTWLRPHPAIWLSGQHMSRCAPRTRSAVTPSVLATLRDVRNHGRLALSAMRRADGHRPDPLGASIGHDHRRLRHLMNARRPRPDRRPRQRDRARVTGGVCRSVFGARCVGCRVRTPDLPRANRYRSRADGHLV
jgi:hypothetical protein